MTILSQGAEAIISKAGDRIVKVRPAKSYRHETIDKRLRKSRTRREAKVLTKLSAAGIPAPVLLDMDDKEMRIEMSLIEGSRLRDKLAEDPLGFADQVGTIVAMMHQNEIIHGDLTTSNLMVQGNTVHVIDFGLSFFSQKVEDMAVDLNVLFRTLAATHNDLLDLVWNNVLAAYQANFDRHAEVFERLEKVQGRGRNKSK